MNHIYPCVIFSTRRTRFSFMFMITIKPIEHVLFIINFFFIRNFLSKDVFVFLPTFKRVSFICMLSQQFESVVGVRRAYMPSFTCLILSISAGWSKSFKSHCIVCSLANKYLMLVGSTLSLISNCFASLAFGVGSLLNHGFCFWLLD